ncbi:MAG TPA: TolC family protein [Vicinamibacterales bacterium]
MRKHLPGILLMLGVVIVPAGSAAQTPAPTPLAPGAPMIALTFDEAVQRAAERNPGVAQAAQAILQAEALLQSARSVFYPTVSATVNTTVLDRERGFDGNVTQPQTQSAFGASASYPVLAAARWAQRTQAEDQVRVARIAADEVRRQIVLATSEAYLAVIAQRRQLEVNERALENAMTHRDYATTRLRAGAGSRLNELRAMQEVSTVEVLVEQSRLALRRAQEALGVLVVEDGPVDAAGEPAFELPAQPPAPDWLTQRTDVRLAREEVAAAERVARDSWKDWVPTGTLSFQPQYITPSGLFQPSRSWSAFLQFSVPVFDGGQRRAAATQRRVQAEIARLEQQNVEIRVRSELRAARAAVESTERALESARRAAEQAHEVVRITDVAFRAGATTNLELIDAQRRARDADTAAAQAEDRVRQARLDLLVALGLFPK